MGRFGVEYSFIGGTPKRARHVVDALVGRFRNAHVDHTDTVEVPSPKHKSLAEAERFYKKLIVEARRYRVPARRLYRKNGFLMVEGTGGGHVHVEMPKDLDLWNVTARNLCILTGRLPWLGWVFNDFVDTDQAEAALYGDEASRTYVFLKTGRLPYEDPNIPYTAELFKKGLIYVFGYGCNAMSLRTGLGTTEFRFFDAPRSWKQAKEHIIFARSLVKYCTKMNQDWKNIEFSPLPTIQPWETWNKKRCGMWFKRTYTRRQVVKEFKALIAVLGLEWRDYKKYMRNYDDRLAFSKFT